ncbi:MAG TPA: type II pantothenate kinase [Bacillales bacterium]|nr:type II pantothenate kinase [Bacillales bacterium]
MRVGIDVGGTLIKIAYESEKGMQFRKFAATKLDEAAKWVMEKFPDGEVCVTGGKAERFQACMGREVGLVAEFEATCRGIRHLLNQNGHGLDAFVVANVGTGTSIHYIDGEGHRRIGGTGVGGGTIMGLSALLCGIDEYDKIVRLAKEGNRGTVDLKVRHIYEGSVPPISGDLTASNFGRVSAEREVGDVLAAVIGLVGETVATVSVFAAEQCRTSSIVFIGTSFVENGPLQAVVKSYAAMKEADPVFVKNGEFSGALGALFLNQP